MKEAIRPQIKMSADNGRVHGGTQVIEITRVPRPYESAADAIVTTVGTRAITRPHGDLIPKADRQGLTNARRRELREAHRVGPRTSGGNSGVILDLSR